MKYKKGDKVRVINAMISQHLIGKILKVRMVVEGQVYLEGSTSSWGENSDYIELVKKRKPRRNLVYSIT